MSEPNLALPSGLATRGGRDGALVEALERLAAAVPPAKRIEGAYPLAAWSDAPERHVTALRRLPPVPAQYAPFPESLDERLRAALRARGIQQLYTHQAEAVEHALAGRNVVVVTP